MSWTTEVGMVVVGGVLMAVVLLALRFALSQGRAQGRLQDDYETADAQRERLAGVLRSVPDGLLVMDAEDKVLMANAAAAGLWGLGLGEIGGLPASSLAARPVLRSGEDLWRLDTFLQGGRGQQIDPLEVQRVGVDKVLEVSGSPVLSPSDGTVIGTIVLFRDMTEQRELEAMKDNLTHMMVHDLKTPLSAIQTGIQTLMGPPLPEEIRNKVLKIAERQSTRMVEMVETLVDIGRLEAGRMELDVTWVEARKVIGVVEERVAPLAKAKDIDIQVRIEPEGLTMWGDTSLIERIVQNLLANAVKFTPKGGSVSVAASEDGTGGVKVAVRDNGPGIPQADIGRIFDRFTQAGQRVQWGSGLGLSFCKLTVEAHGGRIWVESVVDQGSEFIFTLPGQ